MEKNTTAKIASEKFKIALQNQKKQSRLDSLESKILTQKVDSSNGIDESQYSDYLTFDYIDNNYNLLRK